METVAVHDRSGPVVHETNIIQIETFKDWISRRYFHAWKQSVGVQVDVAAQDVR